MPSVLQNWVMDLPLREQGALLVALRGCDLAPKLPLDSLERRITAAIRGHVLVPADPRETDLQPGCFMSRRIPQVPQDGKLSELGHYPHHWVMHAMHAVEVLGFRHPPEENGQAKVRMAWWEMYRQFCHSLHVNPETSEQYEARLSEDRISAGTVVS